MIKINMDKYVVSPEDGLILLAIRNSQTLREAARLLDCDPGGLLRKVQRIASEHGLLQKTHGKWTLTEMGLAMVGWTQESILAQKKVLSSRSILRIAAPSWFAERVLIPATTKLRERLANVEIQFSTTDDGPERALIEGDCDFAIFCNAPENPVVAHKRIGLEKWSVVLPAALKKQRRISVEDLAEVAFIRHLSLNPESILPGASWVQAKSFISADNLVGIRAALVNGLGWSFVPTALVQAELDSGVLLDVEHDVKMDRYVSLWWLRGSSGAQKKVTILEDWLRKSC